MGEGGDNIVEKAKQLKDEGNKLFGQGDYEKALSLYTQALKITDEKSPERIVFLKNRAAAYLKLDKYQEALKDTNEVLEAEPSDVKALFRRCQAYQKLGQYAAAFKDARAVQHLEPKNKAILPILQELNAKIQEQAKEFSSTTNKVKQMLNLLEDETAPSDKRETAANNLVVLSREKAGSELIMAEKGDEKIISLMKATKNMDICLSGVRILGQLCKTKMEFTLQILGKVGVPFFINLLNSFSSQESINAVQYWVQIIINSLSGMDIKQGKKPDPELMKKNEYVLDTLMMSLVKSVDLHSISAITRDAILELIMKNVDADALNWGMKLVKQDGLAHLLEVASELPEPICESSMKITQNTRTHVAVALERTYWCMDHDKARDLYRDKVSEFMKSRLSGPDVESKVRAVCVITALCMGPMDIGNFCLGQPGILEMMLVMANTEDELQQKVAAEAIIAAAQKKDKCSSIASLGVNILKKLYQSKNETIRVRALVGLCKVASLGGTDASVRPFADGSMQKLSAFCRKFLINPAKDRDLRKWAAEGLSYLTLDADVKEELIEDKAALRALIELAQQGDLSVVYGVVVTLVNLTNSYDHQEIIPELIELAKFAKQHIPEEHPLDHQDFVIKRIKALAEIGVTTALVALAKTESKSCKEMIARVFNAICEHQDLRGIVVQQGGVKALLKLALEGNLSGKRTAAQALSRIAITINPEVAFPGQRCSEVVRPIMALLDLQCSGLQNFEALMALTNLAQVSESVRSHILKDNGFTTIEHYMYEEHEMLKRAATECILNLCLSPEVVKKFELPNTDRVKYLILCSEDDDLETAKAASGTLATLSSVSTIVCEKIIEVKCWVEVLTKLVANENKELVHRGVCIVHNLIHSKKEVAEVVVGTNLFELLMALCRPEVDDMPKPVKELSQAALNKAQELGLIKQNVDNEEEDSD